MASATPILIIFGCAIVVAAVIAIYSFISKGKFKQKVDAVAAKTRQLSAALDELFKPVKRTTREDVDHFLADNHDAINAAKEITEAPSRFKDLLKPSGIHEFLAKIQPDSLQSSLTENHTVYDAIDELTNLCIEPQQRFNALMAPDHYFAYSEMERFKDSLAAVEACEKKVFPKYAQFVTNPAVKQLLSIKKDIDRLRETHNKEFVTKELEANQTYFDTVLGKYPLDPQQRDSIVKLEDNCLVIASAGSGKTSTILGKAKYMVEKRNIDPSKVLLITFTRKAANELHERMKIDGMTCSTFHALAYQIIAQVTGQAPSICDADVPLNVFRNLILNNPEYLHSVTDYIINQQSLMRLEHEYTEAFTYYEDRKKYGIQALFPDVDGKMIFTRSEEEKRLVSLLTKWGVQFRYESPYQYNTATAEKRQYKPDFTIYYQDAQGEWKWVYLEHFAIDSSGNVPLWFGEGTRGGWRVANEKYKEGIEWKRLTHSRCGTTLIETTSADFLNGTVEDKLLRQLRRCGVPFRERTDQELYDLLVKRNRKLEKSVYTLILSFVTLMKANEKDIDGLLDDLRLNPDSRSKNILIHIVKPFYEEYERTLRQSYEIDFTDAIIQATQFCREGLWKHYDCILVDEFQDIAQRRATHKALLRRRRLAIHLPLHWLRHVTLLRV